MAISILTDFDGTITQQDTLVKVLNKYADPAWQLIGKQVEAGKLDTRKALIEEFNLCRATLDDIIRLLENEIEIDPGFKNFVAFCKINNYNLMVLSGGFTLCIEAVFRTQGISGVKYLANTLLFQNGKFAIAYPHSSLHNCHKCGHCKTLHLTQLKERGDYIVYIGEGVTDRCPAKHADLVFAKDKLAEYCRINSLPYTEYKNFADIQKYLNGKFTQSGN